MRKKQTLVSSAQQTSTELPECYYLPFPKNMTAVGIFVKAEVVENVDGEWKVHFSLKLINEEDIERDEIEELGL